MKKLTLLLPFLLLVLSGCSQPVAEPTPTPSFPEPTTRTYEDRLNGIQFEYPANWEMHVQEELGYVTFSGMVSEDSEGASMDYEVLDNPDRLSIVDYLKQQDEACEEICITYDYSEWESFEVDGKPALLSGWVDPGESDGTVLGKDFYLSFDDKILNLWMFISRGSEEAAQEILDDWIDSLEVAPAAESSFQYDSTLGYYGVLTLKGYLEVEERVCNPGDMCGETVQYAWFVHSTPESPALSQLYSEFAGNSFVGAERLGIGCYQEDADRIYSENAGDADGMVESTIEGEDLEALLASDEDHPVDLKMTKPIFTGGSGAPDCYSHFRDFEVL